MPGSRGRCAPTAAAAVLLGALLGVSPDAAFAETSDLPSLEQLMQVEVTTVSGLGQPRIAAPAAVTVITAEDIRRAGHRSVAEALRLVPGMEVARINESSYVVGARGLTGSTLTANRYLVLIDGRVVYDPLFSGTFWDVVDVPLADLDRIEVIRGPGPTLWGANAMNGVISILTRSARDTQGAAATLGLGSRESELWTRFGGTTARDRSFRVWAKLDRHAAFDLPDGSSAHDDFSRARGGFRVDGGEEPGRTWTLSGEAYTFPTAHALVQLPVPGAHLQFERLLANDTVDGGDLDFTVGRDRDRRHGWRLRAYYDRTDRETARLGARRDTVDVDYRAWATWHRRHQLVWGLQLDRTSDRLTNGPSFRFVPTARSWSTVNAFLQDTVELRPDLLYAMVGTKLTHHDFVGLELQPSVRLWATPTPHQTLWLAVSRPVRVPSRLERDGMIILSYADTGLLAGGAASGVDVPLGLSGDRRLGVETLTSYEIGERVELDARWTLDASVFYNDYSKLVSVPPGILGTFDQRGSGVTCGVEIAASWRPSPRWRLDGGLSWLEVDIDGPVLRFDEDSAPQAMAQLRGHFDVARDVELDAAVYHVGSIPRLRIPAYDRADFGVAWRPSRSWRLSIWGRDLFARDHAEASGVRIPREISVEIGVGL